MSVETHTEMRRRAFQFKTTSPYKHFATTRMDQARPADMTKYGEWIAAPIRDEDVTLFGFARVEARDDFLASVAGASKID